MYADDDIFTVRKKQTQEKIDYKLYVISVLLISLSLLVFGFTYSSISGNGETAKTYSENNKQTFIRSQISKNTSYSNTKSGYRKYQHSKSHNLPRRTKAQRANIKNCLYWNKQYNANQTNYNRLMQNDACKRAAITVKTRSQPQNTISQNNYQNRVATSDDYISQKTTLARQQCSYYKQELERIQARMRHGYTASQYNYLESRRKHWQNKLFDECKQFSINSY